MHAPRLIDARLNSKVRIGALTNQAMMVAISPAAQASGGIGLIEQFVAGAREALCVNRSWP